MYEKEVTKDFKKELEQLINKHSVDSLLETPDFILADYLTSALYIFETATACRDKMKETHVR